MPPLTPAGQAERLRALGFRFVTVPLLEFGLREFQTYASAPKVAHVIDGKAPIYSDGLESVENTDRFTGPPHGHADERTLSLLDTWVTNGWRCPVVIEAWWTKSTTIPDPSGVRVPEGEAIEATRPAQLRWRTPIRIFTDPNAHNVWLYDDAVRLSERVDAKTRRSAIDNGVRFYARDFSGWFDGDANFEALKESNGRILLGRHKATDGNGPVSTPVSGEVRHRVTPMRLAEKWYVDMSPYEQTRFRVARAVSSAECVGFFDALNAYDRARMSIGLCHWTLSQLTSTTDKNGQTTTQFDRGELEATVAYLKSLDPAAFDRVAGPFGMEPLDGWYPKDATTRPPIANAAQRKYNTYPARYVWNQTTQTAERKQLPGTAAHLNFLRSWHWFYRFQLATRLVPSVATAMWHMIRFRIRDIRAMAIPEDLRIPRNDPNRPNTLGDLFSSEDGVALLLETHIWKPARVIAGGKLSDWMVTAIKNAGDQNVFPGGGVDLQKPPREWPHRAQRTLVEAVLKVMNSSEIESRLALARTDRDLLLYPYSHAGRPSHVLSTMRNSFVDFSADHVEDPALYPPPPWGNT